MTDTAPVTVEEPELPPAPLPPITPMKRRSFDDNELEAATVHLDQVPRRTRRSLDAVVGSSAQPQRPRAPLLGLSARNDRSRLAF